MTYEVQCRRVRTTAESDRWRPDALKPHHATADEAWAYVDSVAKGPGVEYRIVKRDA